MTERYPLCWPAGWLRTPAQKRKGARFEVSFAVARDELLRELQLLKASSVIISSNVPLRRDGLPYANYRQPEDPGVAVYFQLKGKPHVLACDRWDLVKDNIRAVGLHVAAIRGIERWGVGSVEQAFMGYQALPESSNGSKKSPWWVVLNVSPDATLDTIKAAYSQKARTHHPDMQGSDERMAEINRAWEEAQRQCG